MRELPSLNGLGAETVVTDVVLYSYRAMTWTPLYPSNSLLEILIPRVRISVSGGCSGGDEVLRAESSRID